MGRSMEMLNKFASHILLLSMILFSYGCAVNRATATIDPTADLSKIKSIHVIKHDKDGRNINELIVKKLQNMGYTATTSSDPAPNADAVITYIDKWMWDLTMYMLELTVVVRDAENKFPLGSGNSFHTSLTRKSPEEMVDEVLSNIFKGGAKS
jgi:hypothetical protein